MEARFALDLMNPKLLFIDNQLERKEISEEEASVQKNEIMLNVDFYSNINETSRFFLKILLTNTALFLINLIISIILRSSNILSFEDFNYYISDLSNLIFYVFVAQVIVFVIMCINVSSRPKTVFQFP